MITREHFLRSFSVIILGLFLPLFLSLFVGWTGYSEIWEELFKGLVVWFFILNYPHSPDKMIWSFFFGLFFGSVEALLYLNNLFDYGSLDILLSRFGFTIPMHIITVLIMMTVADWKRWLFPLGFALALALHLLFNFLA